MSKERTPDQPEAVKISYLFELAGSKKTGLYIAVIFSTISHDIPYSAIPF